MDRLKNSYMEKPRQPGCKRGGQRPLTVAIEFLVVAIEFYLCMLEILLNENINVISAVYTKRFVIALLDKICSELQDAKKCPKKTSEFYTCGRENYNIIFHLPKYF